MNRNLWKSGRKEHTLLASKHSGVDRILFYVNVFILVLSSSVAHAAGGEIGSGLITFVQPIILFLGIGAIVVAGVGALFKPELVRYGVYAAVVLVIIFFILRNTSAFQSAVQAG